MEEHRWSVTTAVTETTATCAVLAAGGPLPEGTFPFLRRDASTAGLLIGVDGGARHLQAAGFLPNVVTGDFDSLSEEVIDALRGQGVVVVPTPDQDYTDLDKALHYAIHERGMTSLRVYAATGGRLDHIYSCLSAVVKYGRSASVRLVDDWGETWLVPPGEPVTLEGSDLAGRTLSLITLGEVTGITTTGVRWPLTDETLAPGIRDGTLNEITSERVTVACRTGTLLVMLQHAATVSGRV